MAKGFPVDVRGYGSLIERLAREGDAYSVSDTAETAFTGTALTALTGAAPGILAASGFGAILPGRALYVSEFNVGSSVPIYGSVLVGGGPSGIGTFKRIDRAFMCGPTGTGPMRIDAFNRSSQSEAPQVRVRRAYGTLNAGDNYYVVVGASGYILADSLNFDAKKVHLFIGDSLFDGTGPTSVDTCVPFQVNKLYQGLGVDCRYILKAFSGSRTDGHDAKIKGGVYDFPQVDVIHYQVGTNNALQSIPIATTMADIQRAIAWKQAKYPKAKMIVYGPPPLRVDASETNLAAIRAAEQALVAGLGDPNVLFYSFANSFDRTVAANYNASDNVHPTDAALTLMLAGGYNGNAGFRSWLTTNLPTF